MKWILFTGVFFSFHFVLAGTKPVFSFNDDRAFLMLTDQGPLDASFMFTLIAGDGSSEGQVLKKELATLGGSLKIQCKREPQKPTGTSCVLAFAKSNNPGERVNVSRASRTMGVTLTEASALDFAARLSRGSGTHVSSDGRLSIAADATNATVQIHWFETRTP